MNDNKNTPRNNPGAQKRPNIIAFIVTALVIIGMFMFIQNVLTKPVSIDERTFIDAIERNDIEYIEYQELENWHTVVTGKLKKDLPSQTNYGFENKNFTVKVRSTVINSLLDDINANPTIYTGLTITFVPRSTFNIWSFLLSIIPLIIAIVFIIFIFKNASGQNNKAFDFGKNRAKLSKNKSVTFDDVAGSIEEKEELAEIVDFLKTPKKYNDMGARIPKGVLLVGSPGTGKTLLARAVAGEANVPFYTISGSDFVEMFVGVGASRVRDLFKIAKESAPCIIFIDEIDAVGRQRGAGMGGGHDEREQTLNQLLVEMDGFSSNQGIIIIAATNRPDVLDPALLRPGRFDRQITIDLPDIREREAILKIHARNKSIDDVVVFKEVAQRIPGFSGADIENLLNEAALLAARNNRTVVNEKDLDEAMDRVRMGPAKKSRKYNEHEKQVVAYHEAGHAVIGIKLEHANVVQKVTIIPRGNAGGYNLMMPAEETFLSTDKQLLQTITGYLGGRVAEEIQFDSVTTGAYNDFEMATKIARAMVTEYGMSSLGPVQYESRGQNVFLGRDYLNEKNFSDQVALEIDREVRSIVNKCLDEARVIIKENKVLLDTISDYLIKVETLTKADIDDIVSTGKLTWYEDQVKAEEVTTTVEKTVDSELV